MKAVWRDVLLAVVFGVIVPVLAVGIAYRSLSPSPEEPPETAANLGETEPEMQALMISVILSDGTTAEMEMDAYLVGVVLQEMPADFETEAQKAQAVVARTYALRRSTVSSKHSGGAVCTDAACCQAYISQEDYLSGGGTQASIDAAAQAVASTSGQVLTYEGELIEATYFSCSGGRTEDAAAVWGSDVPYLRAVDSPGEEDAVHYMDTVTFTAEEFAAALGIENAGYPAAWLGEISYTDGGGVDTMEICGVTYKGTTLRQLLGLRSTAFSMTAAGVHIIITTKGYGHRVGMSQYGADAMAVQGSLYTEILAHYYPGTVLSDWIDKGVDLG